MLFAFLIAFFVFLLGRDFLQEFFKYKVENFDQKTQNHAWISSSISLLTIIMVYPLCSKRYKKKISKRKKENKIYTLIAQKISRVVYYFSWIFAVTSKIVVGMFVLVIGNLCGALVNSIVLSVFSNWKPSVYYSFKLLKKMFSYSFWSLCEALANWTIFWVDTFIVGNYFSEYQLGLYKNSTNMVQSIMGMISASMSPVLLSTLSRLKNNPEKYKKAFLNIHSLIIYLVAPMGIGLFLYRKMATLLLFGSKWGEASNIVGAWGLMMMCSVIFYSFPAELYKSKGIPQMLFLSQCIYLLFMIPICVVTAKFGFWIMVYSRCGAIIIQMIIGIVFMKKFFEIDLQDYFKSFLYPLIATIAMILISEVTKWYLKGIIGDFIGILVCVLVYLAVVYVVARKQLLNIIQTIKKEKV